MGVDATPTTAGMACGVSGNGVPREPEARAGEPEARAAWTEVACACRMNRMKGCRAPRAEVACHMTADV